MDTVQESIRDAEELIANDSDPLFKARIAMVWDDSAFCEFARAIARAVAESGARNDVPRRLCVLVYAYLGALKNLLLNRAVRASWDSVTESVDASSLYDDRVEIIGAIQAEFECPGSVDMVRLIHRMRQPYRRT